MNKYISLNAPFSDVQKCFLDLELHLNVDEHTTTKQESIYNKIKRDWVLKFASVDMVQEATTEDALVSTSAEKSKGNLEMGWMINKPTSGSKHFSPKIKQYLTRIFLLGEKTRCKADPEQVEKDMRNSKNTSDDCQFSCNEWLTKTQIKGFFSQLAAKQRKQHGLLAGFSSDNEEDVECLLEDVERCDCVNKIDDEIGGTVAGCYAICSH